VGLRTGLMQGIRYPRFCWGSFSGGWAGVFLWGLVMVGRSHGQDVSTIFAGDKNWLAISTNRLWAAGNSQHAAQLVHWTMLEVMKKKVELCCTGSCDPQVPAHHHHIEVLMDP